MGDNFVRSLYHTVFHSVSGFPGNPAHPDPHPFHHIVRITEGFFHCKARPVNTHLSKTLDF